MPTPKLAALVGAQHAAPHLGTTCLLPSLSFRAKRGICFFFLLAVALAPSLLAQERPKIFGIASVHFYSTNLPAARTLYAHAVDPSLTCIMCEQEVMDSFTAHPSLAQSILITKPVGDPPRSLLAEITFATESAKEMRKYLKAKGISILESKSDDGPSLAVTDPEGNRIAFVQGSGVTVRKPGYPTPEPDRFHLIHAGFVVHDRAAMDHFYKDILGFRLYWQGGMKDVETDWVDMQVPDGTDWIEYMLNVPANADKRELGVMNHIALGVPDIHAAEQQLLKNGMKLAEKPQIGRDGKRQLNLYDPDGTRVEFMEFTPVEKPCCSDYTGPHPKP